MARPTSTLNILKCVACGSKKTVPEFHDHLGLVCSDCTSSIRPCIHKPQGCTHVDFEDKCYKHERWFCEQNTKCKTCNTDIPQGMLSTHRTTKCMDVVSAGSTWQIKLGWPGRRGRQATRGQGQCLVSCAAGIVVCQYKLDHMRLFLWVYSPVSSDRLREFKCVVRVKLTDMGIERTFTPDVGYGDSDWFIHLMRQHYLNSTTPREFVFPVWGTAFDLTVDITKIDV